MNARAAWSVSRWKPGPFSVSLAFVLTATPAAASDDLEEFVRARMLEHRVVGASIALIEEGEISRLMALGAEDAVTGKPLTLSSVFQVGSVSKPVTAWAVMSLVQAGRLDLDTAVGEYLTRWRLPDSDYDPRGVTVRRLLSHTAGLSLHGYPGFPLEATLPSLEASLSGETNGSGAVFVQAQPGSGFSYSGGGYTLLQLVVEEVTGRSFSDYAEEAVLLPLGMTSSSYAPASELAARVVQPHDFTRGLLPDRHFRAEAAASLHTTAHDLARFVVANLGPEAVLEAASVELMRRGVADAGDWQVGLGFFISGGGRVVGHGGSNLGWKAMIQFVPEDRSGIVILTNSESGGPLLDDVLCYWDERISGGYLGEQCRSSALQRAAQRRSLLVVAAALAVIPALILSACLYGLIRGRLRLRLPRVLHWRTLVIAVFALALACWLLFFYTRLGLLLITGDDVGVAAIHFAPEGFGTVSTAVIVLLVTLAGLGFAHRCRPRRPDGDASS
jgi:CubicO group peptidase (beta-lactamase class C family)